MSSISAESVAESGAGARPDLSLNGAANKQKGSSRSRLGCSTCRKRKVKCDEGQPTCQHCQRLQLDCEYKSPAPSARLRPNQKFARRPQGSIDRSGISLAGIRLTPQPSAASIPSSTSQAPAATRSPVASASVSDIQTAATTPYTTAQHEWPHSTEIASTGEYLGDAVDVSQGQGFWDSGLLGQDSIWAQLPIFSNEGFATEPVVPDGFTHVQYTETTTTQPPVPVFPSINYAELTDVLSPISNISMSDIAPLEVILLRHFVDFAIPPILVGVEPRWKGARNVLMRIAKSSSLVRHAICSFSALSLSEKDKHSSNNETCKLYYELAFGELQSALEQDDLRQSADGKLKNEHILASIFFLSYVELMTSSEPKHTLEMLRKAHGISRANRASPKTPLENQLKIWLKLLDAKVVSAGGEGSYLLNGNALKDFNGPQPEESGNHTPEPTNIETNDQGTTASLDSEDILFQALNHPAYNFYLKVLDFAGRIAHLDRWHRPRGSPSDEAEVLKLAEQIIVDLNGLWARRPQILDLVSQEESLREYLSPQIAKNISSHLRTYAANYYACFVHLQRAGYPYLASTTATLNGVSQIVSLVRLSENAEHGSISVSMLWPLMMAGCEVTDTETREYLIGVVESMSKRVGNASRTARLIREICARQQRWNQRADARTVMQEIFGTIFAII